MVSTQLEPYIILVLKISPFVFSILLGFADVSFSDKWMDSWDQYKGVMGEDGGWKQQDTVFHCLSIYVNDRSTVVSSNFISLVFVAVLHLILIVQQGFLILLLPALFFFLLALAAEKEATKFYRMNSSGRNPRRYEKYYYDDTADISDRDESAYKRWFLPLEWDRSLSPPRLAILVEILIILDVVVLEALLVIFSETLDISRLPLIAMGFSVVTALCIIFLSRLVFPSGSSRLEKLYKRIKQELES